MKLKKLVSVGLVSVLTMSVLSGCSNKNENNVVNKEESKNEKTKSLTSFFRLTWTHYIFLMRIEDEKERRFYEIESEK